MDPPGKGSRRDLLRKLGVEAERTRENMRERDGWDGERTERESKE